MLQRRTLRRSVRLFRLLFAVPLLLVVAIASPFTPAGVEAGAPSDADTYQNPLKVQIPGDGLVESCADPSLIRSRTPGDNYWYMYCTTDPLNDEDVDAEGDYNFHLIPILRSYDLVNWTYVGDAFSERPEWVADDVGLWAPNIEYINGKYLLYYTAPWTDLPGGGSALGVATSDSPAGPWVDSGGPVVEPQDRSCCPGERRWTFDADVITVGDQRYIYFGSYAGGIFVRKLSSDGLHSDQASETRISIDNRYEGPNVIQRNGYFYMFVSATDCCRGPLTGYSVFVGRSLSPLGPFVDRTGASFLEGRVGGTPALSMNGNQWVGLGHNFVFRDRDGRYWTVYHAVDRNDPYFEADPGFTKRPVLMDPVDWVDGWPTVRGGFFASNSVMPAPAAQADDDSAYVPKIRRPDVPGTLIASRSDEFNDSSLHSRWKWVRMPEADTFGEGGGGFRFETQAADLYEGSNNASVLTEAVPGGDYLVETRVKLNVPAEGCCFNYVQAGLVIYRDDDNFVKLVHASIWDTRQTEFAKEVPPGLPEYPRYGNTVVGPPGEWTYLRIAKRTVGSEERYTAYTSRDGKVWEMGGTWAHKLGEYARIGLVSMGGSGFEAEFDYVRVYTAALGARR